jgi:transposase
MLTMDNYLAIRVAHENQESKRSIARRLHHSQETVAKVIASETGRPAGYTRTKAVHYPKLGAFTSIIDSILQADESAPPKQRHTSMQLYRRLVKEHAYRGKYDQVRRYVNKHRRDRRETLLPLDHAMGRRMECDFGQISVDYPEGPRTKDVLIVTWSFSRAVFMIATPNQRTESVLHGMVSAFEFFGCCGKEVWWDNPKTIATVVLKGRERKLNDDYAALASHYRFDPRACMPAKGQEKPAAESGVKALQKRACTPVPQVKDDAELNAHLLSFCQAEMTRTVSGQTWTIGERFAMEKPHAIALPRHRFAACISTSVLIDKYQTATFENNRYSVPKWAAFQTATVKAYIDRVEIVQQDKVIATHARSYGKDGWIVEPLHYVAALSVRPHALDHSRVFKDWVLPAEFNELRQRLEREHGLNSGIRQYIKVLQMLPTHPASRIAQAIKRLWHRVHLRSEDIEAKTDQIAGEINNEKMSTPVLPDRAPMIAEDLPARCQDESARESDLSARSKTLAPPARQGEALRAEGQSDSDQLSPPTPAAVIADDESRSVSVGKNLFTTGAQNQKQTGVQAGADPPQTYPNVPKPDLRRFNQLLSSYQPQTLEGEADDDDLEPIPTHSAEAQSESVEIAHDAGRA